MNDVVISTLRRAAQTIRDLRRTVEVQDARLSGLNDALQLLNGTPGRLSGVGGEHPDAAIDCDKVANRLAADSPTDVPAGSRR